LNVLALESSCDDTCAAVLGADGHLRSNVISSQGAHDRFGGVVPEIASRQHLELANLIVGQALSEADVTLDDIDLLAATQGPGLVGALLVGFCTAKALAAGRELPFAPVDHLQGHVAANFLGDAFEPPFLCLIASGGHTLLTHVEEYEGYVVLGSTLDDAAGEAFDKGARMLGLGYPGGAALERLAAEGDPEAFSFPGSRGERSRGGRGKGREAFARSLDFSFAGLKTALLYRLRELSETGIGRLAVGGGVAANGELRRRLSELDTALHIPPPVLCTDNAAMIASAARFTRALPYPDYLALDVYATGERPSPLQPRGVAGPSAGPSIL
jgi:N6-L-threonylcarbamoyladenine synthase